MATAKRVVELVAPRGFTRVGDQLEMFSPVLVEEPWSGKSPRVLTKAFERFRLGPHPRGGAARLR